SVARAVNVRVVAVRRFVLNLRRVDGNTTCLLFPRRVGFVVLLGRAAALRSQHRRDRRRQRRLVLVNVTNRTYVHVRLGPLELFLCHFATPVSVAIASAGIWCPWAGSNCRPLPYQGSALPLSHMGET